MSSVNLSLVILVALPIVLAMPSRLDNIDLDDVLSNKRLMKNYANCLLDKGSCTPDALELKQILPESLETACATCTEKQKADSKKILHHLIQNEKQIWLDLEAKYDPEGKYKAKYCDLAKEQGEETHGECD